MTSLCLKSHSTCSNQNSPRPQWVLVRVDYMLAPLMEGFEPRKVQQTLREAQQKEKELCTNLNPEEMGFMDMRNEPSPEPGPAARGNDVV